VPGIADAYVDKKLDNVNNSSGIAPNLQEHHREITGTLQGVHRGIVPVIPLLSPCYPPVNSSEIYRLIA